MAGRPDTLPLEERAQHFRVWSCRINRSVCCANPIFGRYRRGAFSGMLRMRSERGHLSRTEMDFSLRGARREARVARKPHPHLPSRLATDSIVWTGPADSARHALRFTPARSVVVRRRGLGIWDREGSRRLGERSGSRMKIVHLADDFHPP